MRRIWRTWLIASFGGFILGTMLTLSLTRLDENRRGCSNSAASPSNGRFLYNKNARHREGPPAIGVKEDPIRSCYLAVLIITSPKNEKQRLAARETWLSFARNDPDVCHWFVIGNSGLADDQMASLESEQDKFGDLVFVDVPDTYEQLAGKWLAALGWFDQQGPSNVRFVLKLDDDSFARTHEIVGELRLRYSDDGLRSKWLYWGFFNGHAVVQRQGKWREPGWFLCDRYVPYALGGGYVLGRSAVHWIAENADNLVLYRSEDVSTAVWLAPMRFTWRVHDPRFDTEWTSRGCHESYLVTHKQTIEQLYAMARRLRQDVRLCDANNTQRVRYGYIYNWTVSPSKCCFRNSSIP